jgi:hypothetical protein
MGFEMTFADLVQEADLWYTDQQHPTKYINRARAQMVKVSDHPAAKFDIAPGDWPFGIEWTLLMDDEVRFVTMVVAGRGQQQHTKQLKIPIRFIGSK